MLDIHKISSAVLAIGILLNAAAANNSENFGKFTVHYNTLPATSIPPQVAKLYGITRSKYRGMLNVTVLEQQDNGANKAVSAKITAQAKNLNNQLKQLDIREIREQEAIYYIAEFGITDGENLKFSLVINPDNAGPYEINFQNEFFTE